ncbi:putative conserved integral membrane protein [Corynebacterium pseudotuberculosis]|nr:Putative conserved integral membrane protein [Corynebacterium pseudotuberculosis]AUY61445.1 Putative conserved integral membrane protein [Corynebacterium pseudotuberculosis]KEX87426.1 putative conserved integral membrane protein [Corynebacterium pseudotuberculosis]
MDYGSGSSAEQAVRGVHWPSDVLAGALLGAGVVAATYAVMRKTAAARTH